MTLCNVSTIFQQFVDICETYTKPDYVFGKLLCAILHECMQKTRENTFTRADAKANQDERIHKNGCKREGKNGNGFTRQNVNEIAILSEKSKYCTSTLQVLM